MMRSCHHRAVWLITMAMRAKPRRASRNTSRSPRGGRPGTASRASRCGAAMTAVSMSAIWPDLPGDVAARSRCPSYSEPADSGGRVGAAGDGRASVAADGADDGMIGTARVDRSSVATRAGVRSLRVRLLLPLSVVTVVIAVGTVGYYLLWQADGGTWMDALFMTVTTITTIGYGEVRPLGTAGRIFTMVLA